MEPKKWYKAKTIWVNFIGFAGAILVVAGVIENELSPETVALALTVINFILRMVTKEEIVW